MKAHYIILFFALIWITITAHFSSGFLHPDEHYQIIEFAEYLNGTTAAKNLAWEFNARLRPSLQPYLCYSIFEVCKAFSITDPYAKTFILRLITGIFAVL